MRASANIWQLLCRELDERRQEGTADERVEAIRVFEDAARRAFSANSPRLQDALEITGDNLQALGLDDQALRCFRDALGLAKAADIPQPVARIATKLAILGEGRLDDKTIVRFYVTAIEALDEGSDRSQLATLLNNLAGLHRRCGDESAAERTYRRALHEAQRMHGPHHPEVAIIANNLAVALTEDARYDEAEHLHMTALAIREQNFGGVHPDVAQSLANLAAVQCAKGDTSKGEQYYKAALDILLRFRQKDDPEVMEIRRAYERLPRVRLRNLAKTRRM